MSFELNRGGRIVSHHRARKVAGASLGALLLLGLGEARAQLTATTSYTAPGRYAFTVPPGVTRVQATVVGAAGGSGWCVATSAGGRGASVTATLPVTPEEALLVGVGAPGGRNTCSTAAGAGGSSGRGRG